MKKIIIPLLCVALLTGCSLDAHGGEETKEPESNQPNNNTQPENNNNQPSGNEQNNNENNNSSQPETNGTFTKKVTFYNGSFTGTLSEAKTQQTFISWFNGSDDLLTSITCGGYAQVNYVGDKKDTNRFSTMILGSQNNNGQLTFNFKYNVLSVKVNVQAYAKYYEYTSNGEKVSGYSIDKESKFYLDTTEKDLSLPSDFQGNPEKYDFEKAYDPAVKTVSISSSGGRVFVHSVEINYTK